MKLQTALECLSTFPRPEAISVFAKSINEAWIEEALASTGTATVRRRRLDAQQVIWLVIGMALYRDRPIAEVVNKLDLAMPQAGCKPTVAPSSVVEARQRLGEEPVSWLFVRTGAEWGHASADRDRWRGLALYGVDGSTLRVADTEENRNHFGGTNGSRGCSGYPLGRLVALMALRSHVLCNAAFGPYDVGEQTYACDLWEAVPDDSVTIVDKGFLSAQTLLSLQRGGKARHWLVPAKSNTRWRRLKKLGRFDELVEMDVSAHARAKDPTLPKTWVARAIRYQRKGFRPRILLTSLVDAEAYPATEIISLYHERWETELGYDEIKTDMMDQTHTPLRSKKQTGVYQELWGLLIAYNLVRLEMERIADEADVKPTRISFVAVYRMICDEWLWCAIASPGAIPRHLQNLRAQVTLFVLPERRSRRRYPRAVKVKMSNYAKTRA